MQDNSQIDLYPDYLLCGTTKLRLTYIFNPESHADGVTATIYMNQLNQLSPISFTWLVPGLIRDKINYLIKSLPKTVRVAVNPINEFITDFLTTANQTNSLNHELAAYLQTKYKSNLLDLYSEQGNNKISIENLLEQIELPPYLLFHLQVKHNKKNIAVGDDLDTLKTKVAPQLSNMVENLSQKHEVKNIASWDSRLNNLLSQIDLMPEALTNPETKPDQNQQKMIGYLSLITKKSQVAAGNKNIIEVGLTVLDNLDKAQLHTRRGLIYLIKNQLNEQIKYLEHKKFINFKESSLYLADIYSQDELLADSIDFILRMSIDLHKIPKNEEEFNLLVNNAKMCLGENTVNFARIIYSIAQLYHEVKLIIANSELQDEILLQLDDLIFNRFLNYTRFNILENFPRYLHAIIKRLEKYATHKDRDRYNCSQIMKLYDIWYDMIDRLESSGKAVSQSLYDFKYKIEELRVSLFAQELKTPYPVSVKRLSSELDNILSSIHITK